MGLFVTDFIRPVSLQDKYPTHLDIYGQGGIHSVDTIAIRNTISKARRKTGMLSFVKEDNSYYALLGGIENENWVKIAYFYENIFNFVLPLKHGYILIGDKNGLAKPSPLLIDVRQDIVDLRRKISNFEELNKLDYNRIWIGNYYNEPEERLHIGVINLPPLAEAVFPNPISPITGDFRIPNPTFDYLSPFDWVMSGPFLPQIYATKYDTFGNPIGTDISSSLAMTQVRAAQIMKRFDNANFIVGNSVVEFNWENPKMYLIPEQLKQLYGLGTTYTFTKAQSLGNLETGLLKNTVDNGTGKLSKAISGEDYVNTADISVGKLVILDPLYPLTGHKLIAPTDFSTRKNEPNEFGYPIANTIDILIGIAAKFKKFAITGLTADLLIKVDQYGEVKSATPDIDYTTPSFVKDVISTLSTLKTAYDLFASTTKATDLKQDAEITSLQVKDGLQDTVIAGVETSLQAEIAVIWTELNAVGIVAGGSAVIGGLDAFFNLFKSIPKGDKGDKGDRGDKGDKGDKGDPLLVQAYKAGTAPVDSFGHGALWIEIS